MKERVELSCHTNMSKMYGINTAKEYIDEAISRGWKAIGIADYNSVQSFYDIQKYVVDKNIKVIYGVYIDFIDKNKILLIAKNKQGIKDIYKLLTIANMNRFITKADINKYRSNILVGSGEFECDYINRLEKDANWYDFLQIQPINLEEIKSMNKQIVKLGQDNNKLVVACSNAKFIDEKDKICSEVLNFELAEANLEKDNEKFLHTTQEMLERLNYLGEDIAHKIVVENTNKIADMCEKIILEYNKKEYYPIIDNADEIIKLKVYKRANELYKNEIPKLIKERIEKELKSIIENRFSSIYILASELVQKANDDGILVGARGCVGNSFVAFLLDIIDYNPVEYNLPFEIFAGRNLDLEPDIDLNFPEEYKQKAQDYIKEKLGEDKVIHCGTIGTITDKTARQMVENYCVIFDEDLEKDEREKIVNKIMGTKRSSGIHPGGIMIMDSNHKIQDYTPIEKFEYNDRVISKTHFDYHNVDFLYKLDILENNVQTMLYKLKKLTGIDPRTIKLDDKDTLDVFLNPINERCSVRGIGEFGIKFVIDMLKIAKPKDFNDLVCIDVLLHGTGTWKENAEVLIKKENKKLSEVISNRGDLMNFLISKGIEEGLAYDITTFIRNGKASNYIWRNIENRKKWKEYKKVMKEHEVPEWYIESCEKIHYLFPKSHTIGYTINAFRVAWYKVHFPEAFYKVHFEMNKTIDIKKYKTKSEVERRIKNLIRLDEEAKEYDANKYKTEIEELRILYEMYERGIKKDTKRKGDVYDLINSVTIGDYCREIGYEFNTEEIAVLIYRNKKISIEEKIIKYKELIDKYPDMEVIKRINCEHYDSVKDMIKNEIHRLESLKKELLKEEQDVIYTYSEYNKSTKEWDTWQQFEKVRKTFKEIDKEIKGYIKEYDDTLAYRIKKKFLDKEKIIVAQYQVINKKEVLVDIYDENGDVIDIDNIFIKIPTPFKKGDILITDKYNVSEKENFEREDIFVLDWLCTWKEGITERLKRGNYDSSDMIGRGYYVSNDSHAIICDDKWDYDSFEYYDGEFEGMYRILKAISSLIKGKIDLELFINAYEEFKYQDRKNFIDWYSDEELKLVGIGDGSEIPKNF